MAQGDIGYVKLAVQYKPLPFTLDPVGYNNQTINATPAANPGLPAGAELDSQLNMVTEACRYVSVRTKGNVKNLSVPNSVFADVSNQRFNAQLPEPGVIGLPTLSMAYTWYACPQVPAMAFNAMGCINALPFDVIPRAAPLRQYNFFYGTILYRYPEISDWYPLADGTKVVDITYHFEYNPFGWHTYFRPSRGSFVPAARVYKPDGGAAFVVGAPTGGDIVSDRYKPGVCIYDWIDLNLLFCILQ